MLPIATRHHPAVGGVTRIEASCVRSRQISQTVTASTSQPCVYRRLSVSCQSSAIASEVGQ